ADGFARALLGAACGPGDERRAAALVGWLLERGALQGHTAVEASSVRTALAGHGVPDPDEAVRHAVSEGVVLVFQEGPEESEEDEAEEAGDRESPVDADAPERPVLLGLDRYALAEESLADGLARLLKTGPDASWEEAAAAA
ncbi:DNA helicase RecD, partial [Streptomyces sp. SID3212]|nr:DNA helicase RecD [Streptomyces sp. SID3212]